MSFRATDSIPMLRVLDEPVHGPAPVQPAQLVVQGLLGVWLVAWVVPVVQATYTLSQPTWWDWLALDPSGLGLQIDVLPPLLLAGDLAGTITALALLGLTLLWVRQRGI